MSNRTLLLLTIVVIIGMGIILALNVMPVFFEMEPAKYISQNNIKGSAIKQEGSFYTLNFDQQTKLITAINQALITEKRTRTNFESTPPFENITFYLFDGKQVQLTPVYLEDDQWVFSVPEWVKNGYLKETTGGSLNEMLQNTYDPSKPKA